MNYQAILVLAIALLSVAVAAKSGPYQCTEDAELDLTTDNGLLIIPKSLKECKFNTKQGSPLLAIKTTNLLLSNEDTIVIKGEKDETTTLKPPFKSGWIVVGVSNAKITFNINNVSKDSFAFAEFSQTDSIPVSGDIGQVVLYPTEPLVKNLSIKVVKNQLDPVHLNIDSSHYLIYKDAQLTPLTVVNDNTITIKSAYALSSCSGIYGDQAEAAHSLVGPDPNNSTLSSYRCVNIFETPKGHYEVDFRDFLGLNDEKDQLIIGDSLTIRKPEDLTYRGKTLSFKGNKLAIIYNKPMKVKPSNFTYKLGVNMKLNGGIIEDNGTITFEPKTEQVRFVLKPTFGQFASIQFATNFNLQNNRMIISSPSGQAIFDQESVLPPVIALAEPNLELTIDFSGKSLEKLSSMISFSSLKTHCHKLILQNQSISMPIKGGDKCYLTLGAGPFQLQLLNFQFGPSSCLSVYTKKQKAKAIYSKCGQPENNYLPPFILGQSYIELNMVDNSSYATAAVMPTPTISGSNNLLSSPNYPNSYSWSSESYFHKIIGTNMSYLFSVLDVDLRIGEKLLFDGVEVNQDNLPSIGDIIRTNSTSNITIARSILTNDFSMRRGYKIVAKKIDEIVLADPTKNQVSTSGNSTRYLVKISAPNKQKETFGSRLSFNITLKTKDKNAVILLHDGRTITKHQLNSTKLIGETTSDTLMILYEPSGAEVKLSPLTVDYKLIGCNSTDGDFICDNYTRCVPKNLLCQNPRQFYCDDKSDVRTQCSGGTPIPPTPNVINKGLGGFAVFVLCLLMLVIGAAGALYGPEIYRKLESRLRPGQYSSFNSVE